MESLIPIENIYYLLCYSWNRFKPGKLSKVKGVEKNLDVLNLMAVIFFNELSHLLKKGLNKDYTEMFEEVHKIRGKINFQENFKKQSLKKNKVYCYFDEYESNTFENRIIKNTLNKLIKTKCIDSNIKSNLKKLSHFFFEVQDNDFSIKDFSKFKITNHNKMYSTIIDLCKIIQDNILINQENGELYFRDFIRDEKQMTLIFEEFIRNFYKKNLLSIGAKKVKRTDINWDIDALEGQEFLPKMQTDITIELEDKTIIIDTKYYRNMFNTNNKLRSENLYQITSYLDNFKAKKNLEGILIYPTVIKEIDLEYCYKGKILKIKTLNLNQNWTGIEKRLFKIIST